MKRITKNILASVLTGAMVLSCAACGSTESQATEEQITETEETVSTGAETSETAEETFETAAEPMVWGEINDLTFGISELTLPNYVYAKLDGEEIEGSGVEEDAVYTIPSVEVSEPDEDGYVTYTIDYNITGTYDQVFAFEDAERTDGWSSTPEQYNVIDYYTGTILCNWEDSYSDDNEEIAVTIDNGDEQTTVYVSASLEIETPDSSASVVDDDYWEWHVEYTAYMRITLRAPQSYDGMLLEIDTTGSTEADHLERLSEKEDTEVETVEGDIFTSDLTDCRFTWASDLIIEE